MATKFKAGDIVRGNNPTEYSITNDQMTRGKVEDVLGDGYIRVRILEHENPGDVGRCYDVDPEYFDLVPSANITATITFDGATTHGVLKYGDRVVKRARAVCSPQDTFDPDVGRKMVMTRLFGDVCEVKRPARVGEYIKIVDPSGHADEEYEAGDILKVTRTVADRTYYKDDVGKFAFAQEYVVLENYTPDEPEEPAPPEGELVKGARVKIRSDLVVGKKYGSGNCYAYFVGGMEKYKGKAAKVLNIRILNQGVKLDIDDDPSYAWTREMFESIEPPVLKFSFDAFKRGEFVVHCDTEEKAKLFLAYLQGKGVKWNGGEAPMSYTHHYSSDTCYSATLGDLTYCSKSYFEGKSIPVIPFNKSDLD